MEPARTASRFLRTLTVVGGRSRTGRPTGRWRSRTACRPTPSTRPGSARRHGLGPPGHLAVLGPRRRLCDLVQSRWGAAGRVDGVQEGHPLLDGDLELSIPWRWSTAPIAWHAGARGRGVGARGVDRIGEGGPRPPRVPGSATSTVDHDDPRSSAQVGAATAPVTARTAPRRSARTAGSRKRIPRSEARPGPCGTRDRAGARRLFRENGGSGRRLREPRKDPRGLDLLGFRGSSPDGPPGAHNHRQPRWEH